MTNTVIAVYDDYGQAQNALNELIRSGFAVEHINLSPEQETNEARMQALRRDDKQESGMTGTIGGFFRSLFGSPETERHGDVYSEAIRRGNYVVSVNAESDEQSERATEVMSRFDPVDIDERAMQWQNQGWSKYDVNAPALSDAEIQQERSRYAQGKTAIPVVQEELRVGKREVQRGGVRVFQRVTETPVQEQVRLREEHVSVERHPVDQPATEADLAALKDTSFEVRETAEEAVVGKTARVVEEVVVGKEATERTETVSDTVRRTDVEVEKLNAGAQTAAFDDSDFRRHWQSAYGQSGARYEDYAPAYQYGYKLAGEDRYRGFRWADVEPELQRDWESRNAGRPWERFKDAVRFGWEKLTR